MAQNKMQPGVLLHNRGDISSGQLQIQTYYLYKAIQLQMRAWAA